MALFRNNSGSSARRREVRRHMSRRVGSWQSLTSDRRWVWPLVLSVVFVALATLIVINCRREPIYRPGQLVDRARIAEVRFKSIDLVATEKAKEEAVRKVPAVYEPNEVFFAETKKSLQALPAVVAEKKSLEEIAPELREKFGLTDPVLVALRQHAGGAKPSESTEEWKLLVDELVNELRQVPILKDEEYQRERDRWPNIRLHITDNWEPVRNESEMVSLADEKRLLETYHKSARSFPELVRPAVVHYFLNTRQPTYTYSKALTDARKAEAMAGAQAKPVEVIYQPGDTLVPAGKTLEPQGHELLREHIAALWSLQPDPSIDAEIENLRIRNRWLNRLGLFLLVMMLSLSLVGYVMAYKPRIATNPGRGVSLVSLLLATLVMAWILRQAAWYFTVVSAIGPAVLVAMILTIAYDRRFSLGAVVLFCLLMGVAMDLTVAVVLVSIATSMGAIVQLGEIRHRSTFARLGMVNGVVAAVGVWTVGFADRNMIDGMLQVLALESLIAFVACLFVSFFVLGILPFVERMFKVTTSMSLLELADMNHPLLRRMAQDAPGTFNHSLQVASLAEAAADAIGANGLLARVGAYYHDIGKVNKPHYFVENQAGSTSLHDKLSPAMSLLIIVGHVKDGIEMAREYGLPPSLIHFIESHHGTTLVEYFYHAAKQRTEEDGHAPEEVEYRYPGPKPQTKECAVLMLCDAIESASRTMREPTAIRIEQLVHSLAAKRLMDGQFDECDITLAELHRVEQAITKSLSAIYHGRIKYPSPNAPEELKPAAAAG